MGALSGEGLSYILYELKPCAVNLPHFHPRAAELLYVIKGNLVNVGFFEENGGRTLLNQIGQGKTALFPRGLIHYEENMGCESAQILSALNSEDPGVVSVVPNLFEFPKVALASAFGLTLSQVDTVRSRLPHSGPAVGYGDCMKRCNMTSYPSTVSGTVGQFTSFSWTNFCLLSVLFVNLLIHF